MAPDRCVSCPEVLAGDSQALMRFRSFIRGKRVFSRTGVRDLTEAEVEQRVAEFLARPCGPEAISDCVRRVWADKAPAAPIGDSQRTAPIGTRPLMGDARAPGEKVCPNPNCRAVYTPKRPAQQSCGKAKCRVWRREQRLREARDA